MQAQKRKTVIMDNQETMAQIKALFNLNQNELNDLVAVAKKFDPKQTGFISRHEVDDIMRDLKLMQNDRMIARFKEELRQFDQKVLDLKQICDIYCKLQRYQEQLNEEETITQEYIDAFVALGGNSDKTGYVQKQTILDIIQKEFELNLDLDTFLGDFQGNQLEFEEFCQLFENAGDDAKSFITSMSQAKRTNTDFTVKFKDFEKWEKTAM